MEEKVMERMAVIQSEYDKIEGIEKYDVNLTPNEKGNVNVLITGISPKWETKITAEREISPDEPLDFISDTLNYPNTFSPNSKDIAPKSLEMAYFDIYDDLIVEHKDGTTEKFLVKNKNKIAVGEKLRIKLGRKFKG